MGLIAPARTPEADDREDPRRGGGRDQGARGARKARDPVDGADRQSAGRIPRGDRRRDRALVAGHQGASISRSIERSPARPATPCPLRRSVAAAKNDADALSCAPMRQTSGRLEAGPEHGGNAMFRSLQYCDAGRARARGNAAVDARAGPDLSVEAGHDHRAARRRHRHGHAGAALRRATLAGAGQAGRDREQARRRPDARNRGDRRGASRRPYARHLHLRPDGGQPGALQEDQLRSGPRIFAGLSLREVAVRAGGRSGAADQLGARADPIRQGKRQPDELQHAGRGRLAASVDGIHGAAVRPQDDPRALSQLAAVDRRHRRRSRQSRLRRGGRVAAADP